MDPSTRHLMPFLFSTLDALYATVLPFPAVWGPKIAPGIRIGGTHNTYINLQLTPGSFSLLRAAIGLAGDAFCIAKRLTEINLGNLQAPLSTLHLDLNRWRYLRNFFSHLDDRLGNLDKHGITGSENTNCGIEYNGATGCFHLLLVGNTIHFSSEGGAHEVDVGKESFGALLASARPLFAMLTNHDRHKASCNYPDPEHIYAT